jgi:dienelactone hydrolase
MGIRAALGACILVALCATGGESASAQEIVNFAATDSATPAQVVLRAELFKPPGVGPFPAVVLMHGCGGWQPAVHYALESHAEFLAGHGFVVLDLDSFGPRHVSADAMCASDTRLQQALVYRAYDAFDALRYLRSQAFIDPRNIFLMGQSNGGSVAIEVARASHVKRYNGDGTGFRAIVAYYPWCGMLTRTVAHLVAPLLVFSGGRDDWVSASECENAQTVGDSFQVHVYPEAIHSFDVDMLTARYMGHLVGYDPTAASDSEQRMLTFFDAHLTSDLKVRYPIAAPGSRGRQAAAEGQ